MELPFWNLSEPPDGQSVLVKFPPYDCACMMKALVHFHCIFLLFIKSMQMTKCLENKSNPTTLRLTQGIMFSHSIESVPSGPMAGSSNERTNFL